MGSFFVPFSDGSSVQLWDDPEQCAAEIRRLAPQDLAGWQALQNLMQKVCEAIRPPTDADLWLRRVPTPEMIAERLQGDPEALNLVFNWSMAEFLEYFLSDQRLQLALMGQGIIGTFASPFDPGTASIYLFHSSGRMEPNYPGAWGYVIGGMGMISFILCDIAREAGATVAAGVLVARLLPGEGVELASGERIHAPIIVSNADPRVTLDLLGEAAAPTWQARVEAIPITGCTVKLNVALRELPNFFARPGTNELHHRGTINTPCPIRTAHFCYWQLG